MPTGDRRQKDPGGTLILTGHPGKETEKEGECGDLRAEDRTTETRAEK